MGWKKKLLELFFCSITKELQEMTLSPSVGKLLYLARRPRAATTILFPAQVWNWYLQEQTGKKAADKGADVAYLIHPEHQCAFALAVR